MHHLVDVLIRQRKTISYFYELGRLNFITYAETRQ